MEKKQTEVLKNIEINYKNNTNIEVYAVLIINLFGVATSFNFSYLGVAFFIIGLWVFIKHFLGQSTIVLRFLKNKRCLTQLFIFPKVSDSKKYFFDYICSRIGWRIKIYCLGINLAT